MSLFKKMKLVPMDTNDNLQSSSKLTNISKLIKSSDENITKKSANIAKDERIIDIIDSNLDGKTKLEILKKIFEDNVEVQKEIFEKKNKPSVISQKLLTSPSSSLQRSNAASRQSLKQNQTRKSTKSHSKKKIEFSDIPWNQF